MKLEIAKMVGADYDAAYALWQSVDGDGLSDADSRDNIHAYLDRNPELSLVVRADGELVATVLCGHDGRRGYLHHLAVAESHRERGIGSALVEECLAGLATIGIGKCHVLVHRDNEGGLSFWKRTSWTDRVELSVASKLIAQ